MDGQGMLCGICQSESRYFPFCEEHLEALRNNQRAASLITEYPVIETLVSFIRENHDATDLIKLLYNFRDTRVIRDSDEFQKATAEKASLIAGVFTGSIEYHGSEYEEHVYEYLDNFPSLQDSVNREIAASLQDIEFYRLCSLLYDWLYDWVVETDIISNQHVRKTLVNRKAEFIPWIDSSYCFAAKSKAKEALQNQGTVDVYRLESEAKRIVPDFGTVMAIIPRVSVLANDHDIQVAFLKSVDDYLFYVSDQVEDWDQMEPYIYDIIEDHEGFSDLLERLQSPYRSVHHLPWGDSFIVGDSFNENLLEEIEPYLLHFAKEYPYSTLRYLVDLCAESYKGLGSQYLMEVLRNCATIIEAGDKFWDWLEDTIDEIPTTWANKDEISKWSQKVMSDYSKKF